MPERSNGAVLKTADPQGSKGSNPFPAASVGEPNPGPRAASVGSPATHLGLARLKAMEPVDYERCVQDALDSLPAELNSAISNVAIVIEDEPPPGQRLLGLYRGIPLTRRGSSYGAVLPDTITLYRGPLERLYGHDPQQLRDAIEHVVLHEVAHHFGISDERLTEMDRY